MDKIINESSSLIPFESSNDNADNKTSTISSGYDLKNAIKKKAVVPTMDQSFQKVF